jgi:hypothetical protein
MNKLTKKTLSFSLSIFIFITVMLGILLYTLGEKKEIAKKRNRKIFYSSL